jgi:O-acetyl-ADP-ribose deacetylase (regulator of RNase III)
MPVNYIVGDATNPTVGGAKLIVHVCNDIGAWGRGFVMALSRRWPQPEQHYRSWHVGEDKHPFALGEVQIVQVSPDTWVANLIGQRDIRAVKGFPPVRYEAIRQGLKKVAKEAKRLNASVHMPRIGCGLAGGDWNVVSQIVDEELINTGIGVTVYDFPVSTA